MSSPSSAPFRRRFAAAGAVLGLVAASVFGGAVIAAYAANEVTITDVPAQTPYGSPITISGVAEVTNPALAVHLYEVSDPDTVVCDAAVEADGTWTCDPFTIGSTGSFQYAAYATQGESSYGEDSAPVSVYAYDTTIAAPPTPSEDNTPSFTGQGPPGGSADVEVVTADESETYPICAVSEIADDGTWACGGGVVLPPGNYVGLVTALDLDGVTTTTPYSGGAAFTVTAPPTAPVIETPVDGTVTGYGWVSVSGTADFGGADGHFSVTIDTDPDQFCDETVDYTWNSEWSCSFYLADGANVITATSYYTYPDNSSSDSITATFIPEASVSFAVGPGSLTSTASPTYNGGVLSTDWALAYNNGEGYSYDEPAKTCAGTAPCSFPATPGVWNAYTQQTVDGESRSVETYFLVPDAPTLAAIVNADRSVTLLGTGSVGTNGAESAPRYDVYVVTSSGAVACGPATVDASGFWRCTIAPNAGNYTYSAYQVPVNWSPGEGFYDARPGQSALSGAVSVVVPPAPVVTTLIAPVTPSPTTTPTPTPKPTSTNTPPWTPSDFNWTFTADAEGYHPGDPVTLSGAGLPPAAKVEAEIHSNPVHLGTTIARQNGTFIINVVIPPDTPAGTHEFWVTITPVNGGTSTVVQPAKITIVGGTGGAENDGGGGVPGALGDDRNDPGAPSSFTYGITTLSHLVVNPVAVAVAGGIGLALLLLVAFPAELLNSTLESQYDRFSKVLPKVKAPWWERFAGWVDKTPLVSASIMTLAASIIFGFADPGFGFDITSFRVVLGCFIALFIVGYLASIISGRILGRVWSFDTVLEVKPLTLTLTVVGVVVSRLLDFSPGFLIGLLLGMALLGKRSKADEAKSTLVQTGVVFVMALAAWTAYSILAVTTVPDSFGSTLIFDTLVAITTEGMTALFIGLLPLKFLDGQGLFNFSKVLWAAVYAVVAFAFVAIVIPAADNWGDEGGSVGLWLTVVVIFAAVCIGIYLYFRFVAKPMPEDENENENESSERAEKVNA